MTKQEALGELLRAWQLQLESTFIPSCGHVSYALQWCIQLVLFEGRNPRKEVELTDEMVEHAVGFLPQAIEHIRMRCAISLPDTPYIAVLKQCMCELEEVEAIEDLQVSGTRLGRFKTKLRSWMFWPLHEVTVMFLTALNLV